MEFTDEWSPFCTGPAAFECWNEAFTNMDSDDEEEGSELQEDDSGEDTEIEDGEYIPEQNNTNMPSPEETMPEKNPPPSPPVEPLVNDETIEVPADVAMDKEPPIINEPTLETHGPTLEQDVAINVINDETNGIIPINGFGNMSDNHNSKNNGPTNHGIPTSCFGPFPSNFSPNQLNMSPISNSLFNVVNDGRLKRRRTNDCTDPSILTFPIPFNTFSQRERITSTPSYNNPPNLSEQQPPAITVSHPPIIDSSARDGNSCDRIRNHFEFGATIEVGKEIGIEIEDNDPLLVQIIGEIGETNQAQ
ncbi:hypothetical protein L1887_13878 [Cichorium endivia]|nr:hypothetical protein L1887_13878 [Cichorium endivia]